MGQSKMIDRVLSEDQNQKKMYSEALKKSLDKMGNFLDVTLPALLNICWSGSTFVSCASFA